MRAIDQSWFMSPLAPGMRKTTTGWELALGQLEDVSLVSSGVANGEAEYLRPHMLVSLWVNAHMRAAWLLCSCGMVL